MKEDTTLLPVLIIAVIILTLATILFVYMLIRNNKVYKFRIHCIDEHWDVYQQLPSYKVMMWDFKPLKIESYMDISDLV